MKRYASHYLFVAGKGYLPRQVVEISNERVSRIFPLTEEIENTAWLPGAILLLPTSLNQEIQGTAANSVRVAAQFSANLLKETFQLIPGHLKYSVLYFPNFDFTTMRPVAGTRHIPLQ